MPACELEIDLPSELHAAADSWLGHVRQVAADDDETQLLCDAVTEVVRPALERFGAARLRLFESFTDADLPMWEQILRGISSSIGFLMPQTHQNEVLAHIQDEGKDYKLPSTRGHQTNAALAFHSDRCDLNLLLYARIADQGGEVSVVSYQDAAARLKHRAPWALATLFDGFPFDLRTERIFPSLPWHMRPILWKHAGEFRGHYIRRFITDSQRHEDCPRLSSRQTEALDLLDTVLDELRIDGTFAPRVGELLLLNNYRVMHARAGYSDASEPQGRRLALRTWVAPFDSEALPLPLHPLTGSCAPGSYRGGVGSDVAYRRRLGQTHHQRTRRFA